MTKWEKVKVMGAFIMAIWAFQIAYRYMDKPAALVWSFQYAWIGAGWIFLAENIKTLAALSARIRQLEKGHRVEEKAP
jgi:uncharacterized membrane protein YqjE